MTVPGIQIRLYDANKVAEHATEFPHRSETFGTVTGSGTTGRMAEWASSSALQASTLIKSGAGVLTLSASSAFTLTVTGTGTAALTTNKLSVFASTSSAELAGVISDETGTGALVFANTPTLITPILGTPTSGTLTNCTGLPISTGVSGLGTGVAAFLATPSSANLASAVTDETGSGALVFANTPTLVTPVLGVATVTSINKVTITAPATSATLTIADGKTLTASNTLTLAGTDGKSLTLTGALTIGADTTITGGGTITLGGFTLTLLATGTAALLGTANVFTDTNTFPNGSAAAPAIIFAASSTTGLFSAGVGDVSISSLGYRSAQFQTSGSKFRRASTGQFSAYQFTMYKASASDAAASNGDVLGDFSFNFVNSTPAEVQMGLWRTVIDTATAGSETLHFEFYLADSGSLAERFRMQGGNFLIGTTSYGTSFAKGLAMANGTAPSTSITGTQLWGTTSGFSIMASGSTDVMTISGDTIASSTSKVKINSLIYGSMYQDNTGTSITITSANTDYIITSMSGGAENGMTFQNTQEIKALTAGNYLVTWSLAFQCSANNQDFECTAAINGTRQPQCSNHNRVLTGSDTRVMSGTGILTLAVNDLVQLVIRNITSGTNTATVQHCNMTLLRIGS